MFNNANVLTAVDYNHENEQLKKEFLNKVVPPMGPIMEASGEITMPSMQLGGIIQ